MKKSIGIKLFALTAGLAALPGGSAFAATTSVNVNVTATVASTCNMQASVTNVAFGPIDPFLATAYAVPTPGQVSLQCNRGATVSIDINSGTNNGLGATSGLRAMKAGTNDYMSYHIYQPSGLTDASAGTCGTTGTEWGTGNGGTALSGTSLYTAAGGTRQINLCGVVNPAPPTGYAVGSYLDVVQVTATYP